MNIDGFELQLIGVITKHIGVQYSHHIKINFPNFDGQQICRVQISKSSDAVFTKSEGKQDFFVRTGCSSQPLGREEQSAYEKKHWNR